jgi:hypothetical protein
MRPLLNEYVIRVKNNRERGHPFLKPLELWTKRDVHPLTNGAIQGQPTYAFTHSIKLSTKPNFFITAKIRVANPI